MANNAATECGAERQETKREVDISGVAIFLIADSVQMYIFPNRPLQVSGATETMVERELLYP
jgi:hypothetical protein